MRESVRFCPFASGSSGNCVFVGIGGLNFLVDAGISGKRIYSAMAAHGIPSINGVFVTHEHSDHTAGVGVVARRYKIPVYATPLTWRFFTRHKTLGPLTEAQTMPLTPGQAFAMGPVNITPFEIPHDAAQPVGYSFECGNIKVTVATDMGCVTETAKAQMQNSNILLLESNHDIEMLRNGRYPRQLKDRVMGDRGHLSNAAAGRLLADISHSALKFTFLGHLSEENNRPLIALDTVQSILEDRGVKLPFLSVADRHEPSEMVVIE